MFAKKEKKGDKPKAKFSIKLLIPVGLIVVALCLSFLFSSKTIEKNSIQNFIARLTGEEQKSSETMEMPKVEPNADAKLDIETSVSENADTAKVGDIITYNINVKNLGDEDELVKIQDSIPSGTKFMEGSIKINNMETDYTEDDLKNGISETIAPTKIPENKKIFEKFENVTIEPYYNQDFSEFKYVSSIKKDEDKVNDDVYTSPNSNLIVDHEWGKAGREDIYGVNFTNGLEGNENGSYPNSYTLEFAVDCKEFIFDAASSFKLYADEGNGYRKIGERDESGEQSFKVTFETKAKRNIRMDLDGRFFCIWINKDDTASKVERELRPKVLFMGDSWATATTVKSINSYVNVMSDLLNVECINAGVGGSGYLANSLYYNRLEYPFKTAKLDPDIFIFTGGANDYSYVSNIYTVERAIEEVRKDINKVKELSPDIKIILFGVGTPRDKIHSAKWTQDFNDQMRTLAFELKIPFVDMINGDTFLADGTQVTEGKVYLTGNGWVGNETGTGNTDYYVEPDSVHLTKEGYEYLGNRYAEEVEKVLLNKQTTFNLSFDVMIDDSEESSDKVQIINTPIVNTKEMEAIKINAEVKQHKESKVTAKTNVKLEKEDLGYSQEGEEITYNIEIDNNDSMEDVAVVKDVIPDGTEFVDGSLKIDNTDTEYSKEDLENGIEVKLKSEISTDTSKINENEELGTVKHYKSIDEAKQDMSDNGDVWQEYACFSNENNNGNVSGSYISNNSTLVSIDKLYEGSKKSVIGKSSLEEGFSTPYTVEFNTNATNFVIGAVGPINVKLDDNGTYKMLKMDGNADENSSEFSYYRVTLKNENRTYRNYKVDLTGAFGGVFIEKDCDKHEVKRTIGKKAVFIGNSWSVASNIEGSKIGGSFKSYPNIMADLIGFEMTSMGGNRTGYVQKVEKYVTNYEKVVYAVENINPEVLILSGSAYDVTNNKSEEDVARELKKCIYYARKHSPNIKIIVLGVECPADRNNLPSNFISMNNKLKEAALDYNIPFVDLITGETIAGDGTKLSLEKGSYITEENAAEYINNNFLTEEGHKYLGIEISKEIAKVLNWYGIKSNEVTFEGGKTNVSFKVRVKDLSEDTFLSNISNKAIVSRIETNSIKTTIKKASVTIEQSVENQKDEYKLGDKIKFKITVTNNGTIDLKNVKVTGTLEELKPVNPLSMDKLLINQSHVFEATYKVTEKDIINGKIENIATITGIKEDESEISSQSEKIELNVEKENAHLKIENKNVTESGEEQEEGKVYKLGEKVKYRVKVINDGNVTISNIVVNDSLVDKSYNIESLAPTKTKTYNIEHIVSEEDILAGELKNEVTASGSSPTKEVENIEIEETSDKVVKKNTHIKVKEEITSIPKNRKYYELNENIIYTITVTNDGNLSVSNIIVKDEVTSGEVTIDNLKPGETKSVRLTHTVTEDDIISGKISSLLSVKGTSKDPDIESVEVNDESITKNENDKNIKIEEEKVKVKLELSSTPESGIEVQEGEEITYQIKLTNEGNVTTVSKVKDEISENAEILEDSIKIIDEETEELAEDGNLSDGIDVTLAPNESKTVEFKAKALKAENLSKIKNTAKVEYKREKVVDNQENETKEETKEVEHTFICPVVSVEQERISEKDFALSEREIEYKVKIRNSGKIGSFVKVIDELSENAEVIKESVTINEEPKDDEEINSLFNEGLDIYLDKVKENNPSEVVITFKVKVNKDEEGTVTNKIKVKSSEKVKEEETLSNPTIDEVETRELKIPILKIEKSFEINRLSEENLEEGNVTADDEITYNLKVTNTGDTDATNATVYDYVPDGTTLKDIYENGTEDEDEITWTIDNIETGNEKTVGFKVAVNYFRDESEAIENTAYLEDISSNRVKILYNKPTPKYEGHVEKTGAEEIRHSKDKVDYTIKYTASIDKYVGDAYLQVVDKLPYLINTEESDLGDAGYNKEQNTLTWSMDLKDIDTYKEGPNKTYEVNFERHVSLLYKDVNLAEDKMTNTVDGKLYILDNVLNPHESDASYDTNINVDGKVVIEYKDINTQKDIIDKVEHIGKVGTEYDFKEDRKEIDGYTLLEEPESTSGIFEEEGKTLTYKYAKNSKVHVRYVDKATGKDIQDEITIDGYENKPYETEEKVIEGYTLVDNTDNTSGMMGRDTIEVVYYYLYNTKVIVQHIDKINDNILEEETKNGLEGDEYTSSAKHFEGYVLIDKPDKETVHMTKDTIVLRYYYSHVSEGVIEKHIDEITNEILEEKVHEGNEGDSYEILPKDFKGYDLNEERLPEKSKGKMTKEAIEVDYYYKKKATVRVKYVDKNTKEKLAGDIIISGHEKDTYGTMEKEFDNYKLVEVPSNKSGEMEVTKNEDGTFNSETVVTYYYVHISEGVIEKHIDIISNKVLAEEKYEGYEGDEYTTEAKEFIGYDLVEDKLPENSKGKMTRGLTEVNYYYIRKATIKAEYRDKYTNTPLDATEINRHEGDDYKLEQKEFEGYDFVEVEGLTEGKLNADEEITVIFWYAKPSKVIVDYLEENTEKAVAEQDVIEGHEGDEYGATAKEIEYYKLTKVPENATGIMEGEIHLTYYYKKLSFNLGINKTISKIYVDGKEKRVTDKELQKIEVYRKDINTSNIDIEFSIDVVNTGELEGKATIVENIPEYMKMTNANVGWTINEDTARYNMDTIKPGERRNYKVRMRWINGDENFGILTNLAYFENTENPAGFDEETIEDNKDDAEIIMTVSTGIEKASAVIAILASYILAVLVTFVHLSKIEKEQSDEPEE